MIMDINAHAASEKAGQDRGFDTTPLPTNYSPVFLTKAVSIYHDSKPPFVINTRTITSKGYEKAVFLTQNGQPPLSPIRATLIAKSWGSPPANGFYWTLDLNGQRLIVKAFPNNGCISGAKWVYCCWTGRGEEFENSPIAFTCIHGEYKGPNTKSAVKLKQPTNSNAAVDSVIANNLMHDHLPHVTPLDENTPAEYLDEAKASFASSRPPFVVRKTWRIRKHVFLATQDGKFSPTSPEAELVYRSWNHLDDYMTIDLDGKRFIVSGNSGGPPGTYQYHLWLGSRIGRVKKVLAYAGPQSNTPKASSLVTGHLPETDEDLYSGSPSDDEGDQDFQEGATKNQKYPYDKFVGDFDLSAAAPLAPNKFCQTPPMPSSEPSMRQERPRRKPQPTKRARSLSPLTHVGSSKDHTPAKAAKRIVGSRKDNTPAKVAKRTVNPTRLESGVLSEHSDPPYETPAPTPGTTNQPAPAAETHDLQPQAPASLPSLTPYKQTHTTLRVTRDSNLIGFVPLRLLTCMTMSTLFSSVIAASGHKGDEEPIKCLMVVFDWKDEDDVYKTMYIDKGIEGSFEIFLEIIDEAPGWQDERGKCGIAVEIVRA